MPKALWVSQRVGREKSTMLGTEAAPALRKASRKREALEVLGEKAAAASLDLDMSAARDSLGAPLLRGLCCASLKAHLSATTPKGNLSLRLFFSNKSNLVADRSGVGGAGVGAGSFVDRRVAACTSLGGTACPSRHCCRPGS